MKKLMKHAFAFMMALVLVISPMQAFAAERDELPTEARYDIEKGGTQTFVIKGEDGEVATVTIEELAGNSRVADNEYRIRYDNTVWQASFVIAVSNNKIYNAHTPYIYCLVGAIRFPAISRPSTTHAILAFIYEYNSINYSTGIDAKIINGEIVATKR